MSFGHSFDVGTQLGLGTPDDHPAVPPANEGEIVLRLAVDLELSMFEGNPRFRRKNWGLITPLSSVPAGTYRLQVPVPQTDGKPWAEQSVFLIAQGLYSAPTLLVATALLCMEASGYPDPLGGTRTRCAEYWGQHMHGSIGWDDGLLVVHPAPDVATELLLSSAVKY